MTRGEREALLTRDDDDPERAIARDAFARDSTERCRLTFQSLFTYLKPTLSTYLLVTLTYLKPTFRKTRRYGVDLLFGHFFVTFDLLLEDTRSEVTKK